MPTPEVTIEPEGRNRWLVQVKRSLEGRSATGEVALSGSDAEQLKRSLHIDLAGSRAWLELGEELLKDGNAGAALECAERGLQELGDDYTEPGEEDDTGQKIAAAKDLVRRERPGDGARLMLRMLKDRQAMYAALHKDELPD